MKEDYKVLVHAFGPRMIRSGFAAALAFVDKEKNKKTAAVQFLSDLASADIPGLQKTSADDILETVQSMELDSYMLATRETLRVIVWFKRAVQAYP